MLPAALTPAARDDANAAVREAAAAAIQLSAPSTGSTGPLGASSRFHRQPPANECPSASRRRPSNVGSPTTMRSSRGQSGHSSMQVCMSVIQNTCGACLTKSATVSTDFRRITRSSSSESIAPEMLERTSWTSRVPTDPTSRSDKAPASARRARRCRRPLRPRPADGLTDPQPGDAGSAARRHPARRPGRGSGASVPGVPARTRRARRPGRSRRARRTPRSPVVSGTRGPPRRKKGKRTRGSERAGVSVAACLAQSDHASDRVRDRTAREARSPEPRGGPRRRSTGLRCPT